MNWKFGKNQVREDEIKIETHTSFISPTLEDDFT